MTLPLLPLPDKVERPWAKPASATGPALLQSFFLGGFESASHRRPDGRRVDVIAGSHHDRRCAEDYRLLGSVDVRTVRDSLRWHLIERVPGTYDWSSFLPMLRAAHATGTEVIWDLCHWGVPDWLDLFGGEFPERFARFAGAAAAVIGEERAVAGPGSGPNWYAPINEISFWSWIGGDLGQFYPYGTRRAAELKRQLVRATIAATNAVRAVDAGARFIQPEPLIHIAPGTRRRSTVEAAARYTEAQFEVWDMLAGRRDPELGGDESLLDVMGVNYYWNNQWVHEGERAPPGHGRHRPLHTMLQALGERYGRPLIITETGVEDGAMAGWLGYVMAEVRQAQRAGTRIEGVCLYPVMDYPGWDNDRHCRCGLIEVNQRWGDRRLRDDLCAELAVQQKTHSESRVEAPAKN